MGSLISTKTRDDGKVILELSVDYNEGELIPVAELPLWDIAGLTYGNGYFYMVSDDRDLIARFSPLDRSFVTYPIDGDNQEGITLSNNGSIIVLDEDGTFYFSRIELFE